MDEETLGGQTFMALWGTVNTEWIYCTEQNYITIRPLVVEIF